MSPQGQPFSHEIAQRLSQLESLTIVCGHYEGVDGRFIEECVDSEISVGDFILTGGEIPAMAVIDSVARLVPGVLGDSDSASHESFSDDSHGMLEGPVYTRPPEFRGIKSTRSPVDRESARDRTIPHQKGRGAHP